MKDQYFGDQHDFIKFALIRQLTKFTEMDVVIDWMLTEPDGSNDGKNTSYLHKPEIHRWRYIDEELFDFLHATVCWWKVRDTKAIERDNLLPRTRFYREYQTENYADRTERRARFLDLPRRDSLIFFDPDTGVGTNTPGHNERWSCEHLFPDEIEEVIDRGHSLLFTQFTRSRCINCVAQVIQPAVGNRQVHVFHTGSVAFVLVPNISHVNELCGNIARIMDGGCWNTEMETYGSGEEERRALETGPCFKRKDSKIKKERKPCSAGKSLRENYYGVAGNLRRTTR